MLDIKIDYEKGAKGTVAYTTKKLNLKTDYRIFRIEGRNGSGKTLILEALAMGFCLNPDSIHDESLRKLYLDFCNGNLDQKIDFDINMNYGTDKVNCSKIKSSKIPTVKINNAVRIPTFVRNKYYIFFDSIKDPEKQSEEYLKDVEGILNSLRLDIENLQLYIGGIHNENSRYDNSKKIIDKWKADKTSAEKAQGKIKDEITKYTKLRDALTKGWWKYKREREEKEISKLQKQQEELRSLQKEGKRKSKEAQNASTEILNAHLEFLRKLKEAESVLNTDKERFDYIAEVKGYNKTKQYESLPGRLERSRLDLEISLNKIRNDEKYGDLEFYRKLQRFVSENLVEFQKRYPKFFEDVQKEYNKLSNIAKDEDKLNECLEAITTLKDDLNTFLETVKKGEELKGSSIEFDSGSRNVSNELSEIEIQLESRNMELNKAKVKLNDLGMLSAEELTILKRYNEKDLYNELNNAEKMLTNLIAEDDENRKTIEFSKEKLSEIEGMKEPAHYDKMKEILEIRDSIGKIISQIRKGGSTVEKLIAKDSNLSKDDEHFAKELGLYLASVQKEIIFNPEKSEKPVKVKQIDLIHQAYVLEDGSHAPFKTNTGNILINTLIGKIRSLPANRKSILLIDEISPLDGYSRELLEKEISNQVKEGNVLLAVISIPSDKQYKDYEIHIKEVFK